MSDWSRWGENYSLDPFKRDLYRLDECKPPGVLESILGVDLFAESGDPPPPPLDRCHLDR